jgi:hypothetical protein
MWGCFLNFPRLPTEGKHGPPTHILYRFKAGCPTFARVGAPDEARLVGVTGLTWGSFLDRISGAFELSSSSGDRMSLLHRALRARAKQDAGNGACLPY